jgi:signal peptidase I
MLRQFLADLWSFLKVFLLALAIVLPLRLFVVQPFFVQGQSMEPNFNSFEYLLIDQFSYKFQKPDRGEVIVFRFPENPNQFYIKRIIGLPGETVKVSQGRIQIFPPGNKSQGFFLDESQYLPPGVETWGNLTKKLGPGEYFVLGDNRTTSFDSRRWGTLPKELIVGRVWLRLFPFNRAQAITAPSYP